MTRRPLDRLLRPQSIAVFGGKEARRVVEQCDRAGYQGEIWPVHPKLDEIAGRRCYRTIDDLPGAPDAAFVGVNRTLTIEIIGKLSARSAGGAVCYASGFAEAAAELADGTDLQAALVAAAGTMPILGPNCYGLINNLDGALLWPDQHGLVRVNSGVAIVTQSSNIALNLSMQKRGLPIAYVMTAGNQAQTGLCDIALSALEDTRVTAVGLHVEGFDSLDALQRLASRARTLNKPVIALKVGKSEQAQRAAVSHTASLAGGDNVASALLSRLGIGRVETLPMLIETLKLLHVAGPLSSREISSMSCSGGEASLVADAAVGTDIEFRSLKPEQLPELRSALGAMVTLSNPLDYHTFVWGDFERTRKAFAAMLSGGYALNLLILDFPCEDLCDGTDWHTAADALRAAATETGTRAAIVATLPENMPELIARQMMADGIVPFCGIDETIFAISIASAIGAAWQSPAAAPLLDVPPARGVIRTLDEWEAKTELAGFGIKVPRGMVAASPQQAADHAETLGFPVALKGLGIDHKTESGAVKLNLKDMPAVLAAAQVMAAVTGGFLVEEMVEQPVAELIVGAFRDPVVGLVLTLGAGGILVELLQDSAILTLPTTENDIIAAISRLKIKKLIDGYRGSRPGDVAALVKTVAAVADYVVQNAARLQELDINPLMVLAEGCGVVAADALIRKRS
ncbi:MAG: acetate--CoA ligase family protein [Allorhizobium sp.]